MKTVKDLIEFNKVLKREQDIQVGIRIAADSPTFLRIRFVDLSTEKAINQTSDIRQIYYNIGESDSWKIEPKSMAGLTRYLEPQSNKPLFPWGYITAKKNKNKSQPCHNAYIVSTVEVAEGYGPMLYDCMLAALGEQGLGLMADRDLVSPLAANVWLKYYESRPDVEKRWFNLTRQDNEADCYNHYDQDKEWNQWLEEPDSEVDEEEAKRLQSKTNKISSALNHAYFDNGIKTLKELEDAGLLIRGPMNLSENVFQIYETLLRSIR